MATTVCDETTNTDNKYDTVMSALQKRVEILEKELMHILANYWSGEIGTGNKNH